ncbi:hypothetical protein AKJ09_05506 [Labilithrix luteola]|uniref:Phospholipase/carboxylesterase/thioesterase domain-containing protein n=1 Tax=Labilithrix luteola TaxID=1391654 RepID=A0A0K1PZC3_9BACT|nr:hypothetical protein [Labilithrix luteola]AKU98842.1 hypothetical protein AKJ09_05506 [Labilithrix luteola]
MRRSSLPLSFLALALALVGCSRAAEPVTSQHVDTQDASTHDAPRPVPASAVASDAAPPEEPPPRIDTDWCLDGLTALDEETCYVLPPLAKERPRRLLVYLHGIIPPVPSSPQKEKVQLAVLNASTRAGAAALVPRGIRGIGPRDARDWWAWPTSPEAHAKHAATIVKRLVRARERLEHIAGAPFERVYLAGSSNGAYFLVALALSGPLDGLGFTVDGFGATSGGGAGGRRPGELPARPFYIGYGSYDAETKHSADALATMLRRASWPVRVAEHPFGHGAREVYLDEAFAFWDAPTPD